MNGGFFEMADRKEALETAIKQLEKQSICLLKIYVNTL